MEEGERIFPSRAPGRLAAEVDDDDGVDGSGYDDATTSFQLGQIQFSKCIKNQVTSSDRAIRDSS